LQKDFSYLGKYQFLQSESYEEKGGYGWWFSILKRASIEKSGEKESSEQGSRTLTEEEQLPELE
jgi:hypothetical protein